MPKNYGKTTQTCFDVIIEAYRNTVDVNPPKMFEQTAGSKALPVPFLPDRKKLTTSINSSATNYHASWQHSVLIDKSGSLYVDVDHFIQTICTFQESHGKNSEEPENVCLQELKVWAAGLTKVSVFENKHLEECEARIRYVNALKNRGELPPYFSVSGNLLSVLASQIRNEITPRIKTKIDERNLSLNLENIANKLKTLISDVTLYVFRILRSTSRVPSN